MRRTKIDLVFGEGAKNHLRGRRCSPKNLYPIFLVQICHPPDIGGRNATESFSRNGWSQGTNSSFTATRKSVIASPERVFTIQLSIELCGRFRRAVDSLFRQAAALGEQAVITDGERHGVVAVSQSSGVLALSSARRRHRVQQAAVVANQDFSRAAEIVGHGLLEYGQRIRRRRARKVARAVRRTRCGRRAMMSSACLEEMRCVERLEIKPRKIAGEHEPVGIRDAAACRTTMPTIGPWLAPAGSRTISSSSSPAGIS